MAVYEILSSNLTSTQRDAPNILCSTCQSNFVAAILYSSREFSLVIWAAPSDWRKTSEYSLHNAEQYVVVSSIIVRYSSKSILNVVIKLDPGLYR